MLNDGVTPWGYVEIVLHIMFDFDLAIAEVITRNMHHTGFTDVTTLPKEQARYYVGNGHVLAQQTH